jgi:hypothetical protein
MTRSRKRCKIIIDTLKIICTDLKILEANLIVYLVKELWRLSNSTLLYSVEYWSNSIFTLLC